MANQKGIKLVAQNRRARHDYEIVDTYEAGMVLKGSEVKSLREGKAQLKESFARIDDGEVWVIQMHISPWVSATGWGKVDPDRRRKLLLHAKEIDDIHRKTGQQGLTLIPLSVYFKNGRAKMEIGLAKGRKLHDKRHAIAARDVAREVERDLKGAKGAGR